MIKTKTTKDVFKLFTTNVIKLLEKGIVPWDISWRDAGPPRNLVSGSLYKGVNTWLLASLGYERNFFVSRKQANELDTPILQGQRGHLVVNWDVVAMDIMAKVKRAPRLKLSNTLPRYGYVFNIGQCAGMSKPLVPEVLPTFAEPLIACQDLMRSLQKKPRIQNKESKAYYNPLTDSINIPEAHTFPNIDEYYAALLHQLIHCTGHWKRLYRRTLVEMPEFGWPATSHEELLALIGGKYLESYLGIQAKTHPYAEDSISKLTIAIASDPMLLFTAQMDADAAVQCLLKRMRVSDAPKGEDEE